MDSKPISTTRVRIRSRPIPMMHQGPKDKQVAWVEGSTTLRQVTQEDQVIRSGTLRASIVREVASKIGSGKGGTRVNTMEHRRRRQEGDELTISGVPMITMTKSIRSTNENSTSSRAITSGDRVRPMRRQSKQQVHLISKLKKL